MFVPDGTIAKNKARRSKAYRGWDHIRACSSVEKEHASPKRVVEGSNLSLPKNFCSSNAFLLNTPGPFGQTVKRWRFYPVWAVGSWGCPLSKMHNLVFYSRIVTPPHHRCMPYTPTVVRRAVFRTTATPPLPFLLVPHRLKSHPLYALLGRALFVVPSKDGTSAGALVPSPLPCGLQDKQSADGSKKSNTLWRCGKRCMVHVFVLKG